VRRVSAQPNGFCMGVCVCVFSVCLFMCWLYRSSDARCVYGVRVTSAYCTVQYSTIQWEWARREKGARVRARVHWAAGRHMCGDVQHLSCTYPLYTLYSTVLPCHVK
jgi:hypothetical protein